MKRPINLKSKTIKNEKGKTMAKLIFEQNFTLEVGNDKYDGVLHDLTRDQKTSFDKINKQKKDDSFTLSKKAKQVTKLARKIEVKENLQKWEEVEALETEKEKLEEEIEKLSEKLSDPKPIEDMFKKRIELSVESDDKDAILDAGKKYGYQNVFQTILQDIEERAKKK